MSTPVASPVVVPTVVRFPPSPTGKMHLGNARTALFNWLYARHTGGQFAVRIEDTDAARSTPENIAFIYEGLQWLGLDYDNQPFNQTTRAAAHIAAAKTLVEAGHAFVDAEGVTRFTVPAGSTHWEDLIQGAITVENKNIEPFALLRSDGTPTYHLGVVCDDAHMGVTHVIRGDDHLANTPKHILLFKALGHAVPQFAHMPLILGPDGEKLSKRHGAASVQDLAAAGYLPHAVFNYLLLLGWNAGGTQGDQEFFTREEAIAAFTLEKVHASPARFDAEKLTWFNQHSLKTLPMAEILPHLQPFSPVALDAANVAILAKIWPHLTPRAKVLPDLISVALPLLTDVTHAWTDTDIAEFTKGHWPLHAHYDAFARLDPDTWTEETLHTTLDAVITATPLADGEQEKDKFKKSGKPLRHALTGQAGGAPLPSIMFALGQAETLRRLKAALHAAHHHGASH